MGPSASSAAGDRIGSATEGGQEARGARLPEGLAVRAGILDRRVVARAARTSRCNGANHVFSAVASGPAGFWATNPLPTVGAAP